MSVRHQVRSYVERLFERLKQAEGEYTIYSVYSPVYVQRENLPVNQIDIEEFEVVDLRVNFTDPESIKNFLDRTTRETLEKEVQGFYLLALLLDKGGEYILSSENPIAEELKEEMVRRIESLKEE